MKKTIIAIILTAIGACAFATDTKKVCVDQTDAKTQKVKQVCKEIKVHKKLEVSATPDQKAK